MSLILFSTLTDPVENYNVIIFSSLEAHTDFCCNDKQLTQSMLVKKGVYFFFLQLTGHNRWQKKAKAGSPGMPLEVRIRAEAM